MPTLELIFNGERFKGTINNNLEQKFENDSQMYDEEIYAHESNNYKIILKDKKLTRENIQYILELFTNPDFPPIDPWSKDKRFPGYTKLNLLIMIYQIADILFMSNYAKEIRRSACSLAKCMTHEAVRENLY